VAVLQAQADMSLQPGSLAPALNELISVLWPRIETFVTDMIQNTIEPQINDGLPSLLVKGGGVKFTKVSLGQTSPLLGPIVVEHDEKSGAITMRIGVDISSDLNVELTAIGIPVGVTKLVLKGDLAILMTPPVMKPPFFGGVQVFFPNPPEVDIGFAGAARVAGFPRLRQAIRGAVDSAVANICVLPRRIAIDLDEEDSTDVVDLQYPEPIGILRLTLFSASNLMGADTHFFGDATSDPYVVASLGIATWTSPTINKNLNPVWGGGKGIAADLPVHDVKQAISLTVFDDDLCTADDLIGSSARLEACSLAQDGNCQAIELNTAKGEPGGGSLSISANLLSLVLKKPEQPLATPGPSEAYLSTKISTIRGLALGAQYPFKVRLQVVRSGVNGAEDTMLAESCTQLSHPKVQKELAEAYQEIARNLAEKGNSAEDIAEILMVGIPEVKNYLQEVADEDGKHEQGKTREQEQLARLSVKQPRFDEALQLLLPCDSVDSLTVLVLTILDKKQATIGTARIPMPRVMDTANSELQGPFGTDAAGLSVENEAKGVSVVGSFRLRWLAVDEERVRFLTADDGS